MSCESTHSPNKILEILSTLRRRCNKQHLGKQKLTNHTSILASLTRRFSKLSASCHPFYWEKYNQARKILAKDMQPEKFDVIFELFDNASSSKQQCVLCKQCLHLCTVAYIELLQEFRLTMIGDSQLQGVYHTFSSHYVLRKHMMSLLCLCSHIFQFFFPFEDQHIYNLQKHNPIGSPWIKWSKLNLSQGKVISLKKPRYKRAQWWILKGWDK